MFRGIFSFAAAAFALVSTVSMPANAKVPGQTICYNGICHTVLTLAETEAAVGAFREETASYYDVPGRDRFNPRLETSSGQTFDAEADDTVASPVYPDGTELLLWNPENERSAHVRVNNAGPYHTNRTLDCSRELAERLDFIHRGTARLLAIVIAAPNFEQARYKKGRVYDPVEGYVGTIDPADIAAISRNLRYAIAAGSAPDRLSPDLAQLAPGPSQLPDQPEPEVVAALDRWVIEPVR